jgi:hypothetical protein
VNCIAAEIEGSTLAPGVAIGAEGHFGLVEDIEQEVDNNDMPVVPKLTISEIIAEVESYGRGKRRKIRNRQYDDYDEANSD